MTYLPPTTELATSDDIRWLGSHLDERMDRFEQRMDRFEQRMDRFDEALVRFDDRLHGFNAALRDQTRNILLFTLGTMFSMVAAAVALASIL